MAINMLKIRSNLMMNCKTMLMLYVFLMNSFVIVAQDPIGLRVPASLRGLLLGSAAAVNNLRNNVDGGNFTFNIKKNYQLVVPENELKPQQIWKGDNMYDFTDPDWLIGGTPNSTGWIQQNGMRLRGHNLLWARDEVIPRWLIAQESSIIPDKAKSLLSDYIHTVVGRYRGKIAWWDVVNEAIDDAHNSHPFNLRDCFWFRKLGPDFMKYAFMFAHEGDPDVQLYYNEYGIESIGAKSSSTLELINWLKSQGVTVNGVGFQWHISVSQTITPGDAHYQSVQQFVDQGYDFMVTELDVAIPMRDGKPVNPQDIEKQGVVYRSILDYVLHFSPKCAAMLTWGFTDRYSWIPSFSHNTEGDALPLDSSYQPKPDYWQMQEDLARVISDGVYRLSPQSQPDKCLGTSDNATSSNVQLYSGECNNANEKWSITWLGDGTYRLSPVSANNRALIAYNATATVGEVETSDWSGDFSEEWVFSSKANNIFRVGPRNAWSRVMAVYGTNDIAIIDYSSSGDQNWILTKV